MPSTTASSTSISTTLLPASANTCASGKPTYPAPTMATSVFIRRKATDAGRRLHYAPALGPLAQLVEQGTLNPKVAGSIPARPTLKAAAEDRGFAQASDCSGSRQGLGGNRWGNSRPKPAGEVIVPRP